MFKITKDHEGETVFCIPTGNAVSRYGDRNPLSQVKELKVSEVERKYLKLSYHTVSLSTHSKNFPHYTLKGNCNAGWIVFENREALEMYKTHREDCELIRNKLRNSYGDVPLNISQVARIAKILRED